MDETKSRCEKLLTMTKRLASAVETDIASLEKGVFRPLTMSDPEIERLALLYGREVGAARQSGVKEAPADLLRSLKEAGAKLRALLKRHELLVRTLRNASEGIVKAVAEEVERVRTAAMPYAAAPQRPRSSGSIVYNAVV